MGILLWILFGALAGWMASVLMKTNGQQGTMMDIVLAKDLYSATAIGDEPEPIEVVPWRLDQIDTLLAHPQFHEARSLAALLLLQKHLHHA